MKKSTILLLALLCSGCGEPEQGVPPMNEQEKHTVQQYTDTQRPICIGRFQIDMPQQLTWRQSQLTINNARITAQPMSRLMFEHHIAKRKAELEGKQPLDQADQPFLKQVYEPQPHTIILEHNETPLTPDSSRVLEGYKFEGLTVFKVEIKAVDVTSKRYEKQWATRKSNKADRLRQVTDLLAHLHPLKEGEMPDKPGVCFVNGYLEGGAEDKVPGAFLDEREERLETQFVSSQHPDVQLEIITDNTSHDGSTLLERMSEGESDFSRDENYALLRKGDIDLDGVSKAQEWLSTITTQSDIKGNYLNLEGNNGNSSPQTPYVDITLNNGFALPYKTSKGAPEMSPTLDKASLTDAEAVGLWDAIIPTFKPRKGAF